jgi:hypothetical protein
MTAKPMLSEGGTRVLDTNNETIGFVFTQRLDATGSQLQRWILRSPPQKSYRFQEWKLPSTKTWKEMVTTPAPGAGAAWGADPTQGLWVPHALYVVAQSTPVVPRPGPAPAPTFPRGTAAAHGRPHVMRVHELQIEDADAPLQIIFGDYELKRGITVMGHVFGDLEIDRHKGQPFFTSTEYILTWPGTDDGALGTAPSLTSLDPGTLRCQDAARFHEHVIANYRAGSRYDVVGCNYYQSTNQPPGEDLDAFLFH